ncbi:MAG TPA: hypothetical protein VND92_09180 [Vicinamibacterales bacterium]|nr:hypothetical protein [Vicinamibacterales bacterium]
MAAYNAVMPGPSRPDRSRWLRIIAAISGIYDGLVGLVMLTAQGWLAAAFAVPLPRPPIHADLNGVFLLAVAIGYLMPYRAPQRHRGYLWVMGVFLKGAGALTFLLDHVFRHSPASFLLFAASDGTLAVLTLWALLRVPPAADSRAA